MHPIRKELAELRGRVEELEDDVEKLQRRDRPKENLQELEASFRKTLEEMCDVLGLTGAPDLRFDVLAAVKKLKKECDDLKEEKKQRPQALPWRD